MPGIRWNSVFIALLALATFAVGAAAQGVTTGSITGTVVGENGAPSGGARVNAVHTPSGTAYSTRTRADGRYTIAGMRVGGPYTVTATAIGLQPDSRANIYLDLGVATDVAFSLKQVTVRLQAVEVVATSNGAFSSDRTGASTKISAEAIAAFPTIGRTITDFTRLTPQVSGSSSASFAGQSNLLNNITVDGSYFNNSFGLTSQPGGRTSVSPIPIEALDQITVNIAPYDVRQGNFVGAGVNTVTKSGTNDFSGAVYDIRRNQNFVGKTAGDNPFNPGTFTFDQVGVRVSGPIVRNKLFFFVNYETDKNSAPATTFLANTGGQTVTGNTTRVLETDLTQLSTYLKTNFKYDPGAYAGWNLETPSHRFITKLDLNLNERNKFTLRYLNLTSQAGQQISNSSSLVGAFGNRRDNANSMSFSNSGYAIGENINSLVGEWNSQVGANMSNNMILGYTTNDESRIPTTPTMFPLVDILNGGTNYTSFGFEPFTPNNQLRYHTLQFQDNFTIYGDNHDLTFGVTAEKYRSENVFFSGAQSYYVYNSLADFYTDANDFLANPNRAASPVKLNTFFVKYNNIPGQTEPLQPLDVFYYGAYAQDEWRATRNLKFTLGIRFDVPTFGNTAFNNPSANALTFRDENGAAARYNTSKLPDATPLWSPRLGFNWDAMGDRSTQVRGGTGVFTGKPAYVWVSNQIGANGIITGQDLQQNTTARPFNPNPDTYKPKSVSGAPAALYELDFTNPSYKFPQIWRTNLAVDQRLPWGFVGTAEFMYGKDVNGQAYINANLPASNAAFTGPDTRPRWTGYTGTPRINNNITAAYVIKNENVGYSYDYAVSLEKAFSNGFFVKTAYNYGLSRNTVDPSSVASGSFTSNAIVGDPNNPGVGYSLYSPGSRAFLALSYKIQPLSFGSTTLALYGEKFTQGNASYTFTGDANGDGATNDLIYIPRNTGEMKFQQFTSSGATFTTAQQETAWDAFIAQDEYLSKHRGEYAVKGAVFLPMLFRVDMSATQDLFTHINGTKNSLQLRVDILNVGNLLNHSWGTSQRLTATNGQILTPAGADASGALQYRLRNIGANLISSTYTNNAGLNDVYRMQLSVRYNFQ